MAAGVRPAELVASGPDCLADDVVANMTGVPQETGNPAPAAGTVPQGFQPVDAVLCRIATSEVLQAPPPAHLVPRPKDLDPGESIPAIAGGERADLRLRLTVEEVALVGDLEPLLTALARPSDPRGSGACMAMLEIQPEIFLVDASGRAMRPQWPVDGCGFLRNGAAETLHLLAEDSSTTHEIDQCIGRCPTDEGG